MLKVFLTPIFKLLIQIKAKVHISENRNREQLIYLVANIPKKNVGNKNFERGKVRYVKSWKDHKSEYKNSQNRWKLYLNRFFSFVFTSFNYSFFQSKYSFQLLIDLKCSLIYYRFPSNYIQGFDFLIFCLYKFENLGERQYPWGTLTLWIFLR